MNANENNYPAIDASCRVPLLALFGGASLWLVVGLALEIVASLNFHSPEIFGNCPWLTYGRVQPAANDALVYGFTIPAGLGAMLWIFARLSESELLLPLVPIVAANLWHLGVLIGVVAVLIGDSTGFLWLEFPRCSSVLLFAAFLLMAVSAAATFGARRERALQPPHWFLLAALFWFPWIYSTANLFLVAWPVRGVAQAVIDAWFSNNLIFVWLGLAGLGTAFYLIPKLVGRPLQSRYFALFAFCTFVLFGAWCGIPQGAPVPAWFTAASAVAALLTLIPLIAVAVVFAKTICSLPWSGTPCKGGPLCYAKFGTGMFLLSALMFLSLGCPHFARVMDLTWYAPAQTLLQILGFFSIVICGAVYEAMPGVMGFALPFPKFVRAQHWCFIIGLALLVLPLAIGGIEQGIKLQNPEVPFADLPEAMLMYLRVSTLGLLSLLLGSLLFAVNIFAITFKWQAAVAKSLSAAVGWPLKTGEAES
jgi:cytochrome c oxidase cbb3-type subunit I